MNKQAAALVEAARGQIGYREGGGDATRYGAWYGLDHNPWCMMFVSWCAAQAGIGADVIPRLAYVPYAVEHFRRIGCWRERGSYIPQAGDLIFFGSSSHIGIVESCNGVSVVSIEGNTSADGNSSNGDGVYRRSRALNHSWIMGYAAPRYAEDDAPQAGTVRIRVNGEVRELGGFLLNGTNYIRLRDVEQLAAVRVGWDEAARIAVVDAVDAGNV